MSDIVKLAAEASQKIKALSKDETEVFNIIIDYLDTLPDGFFVKNTVAQLNKHFGGHDNLVVTENVRSALAAQQELEGMFDAMAEVYGELGEEEEEE